MASLKKNFSIDKLYSDLEKYEANLNVSRNSRVKRNGSGASLHRPASGYSHVLSNKASIEIRKTSGVDRFAKPREERRHFIDLQRPNNMGSHLENGYFNDKSNLKLSYGNDFSASKNNSILKEREVHKENRDSHQDNNSLKFSKNDEMTFLKQCNKLYGFEMKEKMEEDSVKMLLNQINKRDEIYDLVCKRLGPDCTGEKVREFFLGYERMKAIIDEFKRMSKLNIDDEEELFNFLRSEEVEE